MKLTAIVLCAVFFVGCKKKGIQEGNEVNKKPKEAVKQPIIAEEGAKGGGAQLDITVPVEMGWKSVTVDSGRNTGYYNSLGHGIDGGVAIAYYDATKGDLKCAMYAEDGEVASWNVDLVDSLGDVGLRPSLEHDPAGNPAISYYDWTNRNLKYAVYRKETWVIETVDEEGDVGQFSSLHHDAEGRPGISYYDRSNGDLKYAWRNESGWRISVVDSAGRVGLSNCLRYAPDGMPAISYYDGGKRMLKCAAFYQDEWHSVIVDDGMDPDDPDDLEKKAEVGLKSSLAFNAEGRLSIAYFDNKNAVTKYAVYQSSVEDFKYNEAPRDQWKIDAIDVIEHPGQVASLNILPDGSAAISCNSFKERRLFYLKQSENGWQKEPVFAAGLVGEVTSLSHAPNGRPVIACYSETDEELRLLSWTVIPKEEVE
jgi:hypothetical protein